MKDGPTPSKRRRYDAAFQAEALRLADESCSAQVAARASNINSNRLYKWQTEALTPWQRHVGRRLVTGLRKLFSFAPLNEPLTQARA